MINLILNYISPMFYKILYMSIIGIFVGIFILIARKIFDKKISPKWKCIIWMLLMIELIIPIKFKVPYKYKNTEIISISGLVEPIQDVPVYEEIITKEESTPQKVENNNDISIENKEEDNLQYQVKNIFLYFILPIGWITGILANLAFIFLGEKNILTII